MLSLVSAQRGRCVVDTRSTTEALELQMLVMLSALVVWGEFLYDSLSMILDELQRVIFDSTLS